MLPYGTTIYYSRDTETYHVSGGKHGILCGETRIHTGTSYEEWQHRSGEMNWCPQCKNIRKGAKYFKGLDPEGFATFDEDCLVEWAAAFCLKTGFDLRMVGGFEWSHPIKPRHREICEAYEKDIKRILLSEMKP